MAVIDKSLLRKEVRVRLSSLTYAEIQDRSSAICHDVNAHLAVSGARVVAMFSPLHDEPQIWSLVEELAKDACGHPKSIS
jgi:5-formyltetrahydrofolate cyclo-ligase